MPGFRSFAARAAMLPIIAYAPASAAQQSANAEPAQVLVLGTYHFANPGLDVVKTEVADVLSQKKQAEIEAVVAAIARFQPTKIAVEHQPSAATRLDSLYTAFRAGRHKLGRDETEQLGFRLAARFNHQQVHPIDHRGDFPFEAVVQYAQVHDPAFLGFVQSELGRITEESNRRQREHTVGEILRLMNDPVRLREDHGSYLRFAQVGAGDTYVGADLLAKWYERNIRIFANLQRLSAPGERVVVIIGAGHAPIVRELITYHPQMTLVDTEEYLPE